MAAPGCQSMSSRGEDSRKRITYSNSDTSSNQHGDFRLEHIFRWRTVRPINLEFGHRLAKPRYDLDKFATPAMGVPVSRLVRTPTFPLGLFALGGIKLVLVEDRLGRFCRAESGTERPGEVAHLADVDRDKWVLGRGRYRELRVYGSDQVQA